MYLDGRADQIPASRRLDVPLREPRTRGSDVPDVVDGGVDVLTQPNMSHVAALPRRQERGTTR